MTKSFRVTETTSEPDGVAGGRKTIYWRALKPLNKDGKPAKRAARRTGAHLVKYADGSYRYYGPRGPWGSVSLARESISAARADAELRAPDFGAEGYWQ